MECGAEQPLTSSVELEMGWS